MCVQKLSGWLLILTLEAKVNSHLSLFFQSTCFSFSWRGVFLCEVLEMQYLKFYLFWSVIVVLVCTSTVWYFWLRTLKVIAILVCAKPSWLHLPLLLFTTSLAFPGSFFDFHNCFSHLRLTFCFEFISESQLAFWNKKLLCDYFSIHNTRIFEVLWTQFLYLHWYVCE